MGIVYLAHHRGLRRDVALKVVRPTRRGPEFLARFQAEATALGRLRHPHIVDVTDFGVDPRDDGIPYLVMEYLSGVPLTHALKDGPIIVVDALPILAAVASAIDFAHEHDVLHRDIKPENIFLSETANKRQVVKVVDFGIAHIGRLPGEASPENVTRTAGPTRLSTSETVAAADDRARSEWQVADATTVSLALTTPGEILGTLPYLGPELLAGDVASRASDVYAFGVVAYQTIVGQRPYEIASLESASCPEAPPAHTINKALDPEISRVLAWPLSRYASDRPRSARQFVEALRRACFQSEVRAWRRSEFPRRRWIAAAVALGFCALAWAADRRAWVDTMENRLVDARFRSVPGRMPDPRVVVVLVDDESLAASPTLLGERADEFAERFEQIFQAGAGGIAVDLLLPQRWSTSPRFSRLVLAHADRLALAAMSAPDGHVVGPECIAGLTAAALGPERASALFGFVNIEPDADGVIRRARLSFRDTTGTLRDSFAVRSVRAALGDAGLPATTGRKSVDPEGGVFLIDASVDHREMRTVSWANVSDELAREPSLFRDRLVLVGGSFVGSSDLHRLSGQGASIEGVFVQAVMLNTILQALPIRHVDIALWLPMLFVAAWIAAQRELAVERFPIPVSAIVIAGAWIVGAVIWFAAGWTVPMLLPATVIVMAGIAAVFIRLLLRPFPQPVPMLV
jgi:CHASE2 domain-containing sensor protein